MLNWKTTGHIALKYSDELEFDMYLTAVEKGILI